MNSHVADNMSYTLSVDCFNSQWLQLHCYAGGIGKEVARAAAHGLSGGVFSVLGGGSFGSGAASGAVASGVGSFVQSAAMGPGMMIATSAAIGGVAAWATGGDFLKGALMGLKIGLFNHGMHDYAPVQTAYRVNDADNLAADLPEVVFVANRDTPLTIIAGFVNVAANVNTSVNSFGLSLEKHSGNSTAGNNGSLYFHKAGERGFYGNQYVKTVRLDYIGKNIVTKTKTAGNVMGFIQVGEGVYKDYLDYQGQGSTWGYNTVRAAGVWGASIAGAKIGVSIGGEIGFMFGGIGSIPGMIIGGAVGAVVGAYCFGEAGGMLVDGLYGVQ